MQTTTQDRLELALRASNEGIWQWNVIEQEVSYSERVLSFLGYDSGEAPNIFLQPDLYLHEDDLPLFKQEVGGILRDRGTDLMAVDCRYRRPEGYFAWLRIRGACIRNDHGRVTKIAGSMIDISKRKNAENALSDERHLLRQLIENIPNNIYFKDRDSRFVMVNKATAVKMGYQSPKEIIGKTDHDFFDKVHADKSRSDEVEIMESLLPQEESLERETWEGGEQDTWVLTTKIPWLDSKGGVRGTFGVTSDVSDMVNVQIRLSNAAAELKKRNQEYQEELELARQVQHSVLDPKPESFPRMGKGTACGVGFSTYYKPDSEMAGDFYEVFAISDTKAGVLICDVMGHGVRAALVVAMLRGLIEKESDSAESPEWFLYGLNDSLVNIFSHAGIQMFATALYLIFDLEKGRMEFATAGHPLPIIRKDGVARVLSSEKIVRGPALGLVPEAPYGADSIGLDELDQVIMFTDGIYEVENAEGEELGVERLIRFLSDRIQSGGGETLDAIVALAGEHCGCAHYGDDVCMLAVDVHKKA
ncbi:SpoIIE family protein phosphatase [Rubritalea tangerina]|uniref:SpoIIE family protein phosphatase n=1 Tax=Rubritalea tangerina TaxID=430798 RepID=A0ABW4ZA76_9BACT